jgi:hypothetical protein
MRSGRRSFDVNALGRLLEFKFGKDSINEAELDKDVYLMAQGYNIEYHFVDNPVTGETFNTVDIRTLDRLKIPYRLWEHWELWNT